MIRFACPQCQEEYQVEPEVAGRNFDCPRCFKKIKVPIIPVAKEARLEHQKPKRPLNDAIGGCCLLVSVFGILVGFMIALSAYGHDPRTNAVEIMIALLPPSSASAG